MEETKSKIRDFTGDLRDYLETRIDIIKIDAADTGASAASSMVAWVAISIAALFTLFLLTIGSALVIGYLLENIAAGFFIIAGVYLLIALLLYANRDKWIRKPMVNSIIKSIYNNGSN